MIWETLTYLWEGFFPMSCLSYLSPHASTWWRYLNLSPVKKVTALSTVYPACLLPLKIIKYSTVLRIHEWWEPRSPVMLRSNGLTKERPMIQCQASVSVSWLQESFTWNGDTYSSMPNHTPLYLFKASFALVKVDQQTWREVVLSSNWTEHRSRNLKMKFG